MAESQVEIGSTNREMFAKYKELLPEVGRRFDDLFTEIYKPGALDSKTKRLMALTGALVHGCRACILAQTHMALEDGANAQEILEACSVAISLGGTMAAGETTRVIDFLTELGKI